ncbi:hypothetical protein ACFWOT_17145 [Streptomyces sp. NPDC058440]|uniref:hypothetical protein n=1 Tax=Streptomyces sp. NPDC058440 TaxID=3346501 RepID=UPI00364F5D81
MGDEQCRDARQGVKRDRDGDPVNGEPVVIDLPPILTPAEIKELKAAAKRPARRSPQRRIHELSGRVVSPCGQRQDVDRPFASVFAELIVRAWMPARAAAST